MHCVKIESDIIKSKNTRVGRFIRLIYNSMKLHKITYILVIIGGINWLVFGIAGWDIVGKIFGGMDMMISKIIYILVGLSAVYEVLSHKKMCRDCEGKMSGQQM